MKRIDKNITRKGFLAGTAVTAGLVGLAGCTTTTVTSDTGPAEETGDETGDDTIVTSNTADVYAAPDASAYPIDAEEWGSGTPLYTAEVVGDSRTGDGWTRAVNENGATVGVMDASKLIQVDGLAFKDTNGNGKLDVWEDWRQDADTRSAALAAALTMDQAAALLLHGSYFSLDTDLEGASSAREGEPQTIGGVFDAGCRTLLNFSFGPTTPKEDAKFNNAMQQYCEALDYAIPLNISCNPQSFGFPNSLGLGATFDPEVARQVASYESKAYRAEGIATLLGPQIDMSSEPRWTRITGTYGEDPALSRDMTNKYVSGLQSTYGDDGSDLGWGTDSIIGMIKHFPGDGPGERGRESHNGYGKYCVYPGDNFKAGLVAFVDGGFVLDGATAESAAVMTSYSIAWSEDLAYGDLVGSGFSKWKIDLLRENCGYDGLICTDWGITEDVGTAFVTTCWGMEDKSLQERIRGIMDAGCDQIGGEGAIFMPNNMSQAFATMAEELGEDKALERAQNSARRVLRPLYQINLMDNPYVDCSAAESIVQDEELLSFAVGVMDKSIVLLKNKDGAICDRSGATPTVYIPMKSSTDGDGNVTWALPVTEASASALMNVVTDTVAADGSMTRATADEIATCDYALVFVDNPSTGVGAVKQDDELHDYDYLYDYYPVSLQYGEYVADGPNVMEVSLAGDPADGLSWSTHDFDTSIERQNRSYLGKSTVASNLSDLELIQEVVGLAGEVPVIVCADIDRPMIVSEFESDVSGILMGFGSGYDTFLNVASCSVEPSGLLPLQMPANMDTVEAQCEDVPRDMECHVDSEGNEYDFAFGMNWSGVINDDRVTTYSAEPLTEPETVQF